MLKQYKAIAKVKRQILEQKEAALMKARAEVKKCQNSLELISKEINSLSAPTKGAYQEFLHVKALHEQLMRQKNYLKDELLRVQKKEQMCLRHFNEAKREFEKIKYLQESAYTKVLNQRKREEQNALDEVAFQLHVLQER